MVGVVPDVDLQANPFRRHDRPSFDRFTTLIRTEHNLPTNPAPSGTDVPFSASLLEREPTWFGITKPTIDSTKSIRGR